MGERETWFRRRGPVLLLPLTLLLSAAALPAAGADATKPSTPFEGFSSDSDNPVNIKADALETHNDEQKAIFTGNVEATQGDSVLTSDELTVFYEAANPADGAKASLPADATAPAAAPAQASAGSTPPATPDAGSDTAVAGNNKVKRLVAKGHVIVTSKDQKATGDDGILDMETNIATMTGEEVVMTQACNVMKGKKLVVNTKTGLANVSGGTTGHFVSGTDPTKC